MRSSRLNSCAASASILMTSAVSSATATSISSLSFWSMPPLSSVDQVLPGDVGPAAAPELLDLGELIQSVLELLLDLLETIELGRIRP